MAENQQAKPAVGVKPPVASAAKAPAVAPVPPPAVNEIEKVNVQTTALAQAMSGQGETGFENTDSADYVIPFVTLLQKTSPQCDEDKDQYNPNAKPGQFFDATTGEILDELTVIPCEYTKRMVEWKPDMGGFVAIHEMGVEAGLEMVKGKFINGVGNELIETRTFYCLRETVDGDWIPAILTFTSSNIKEAKNWITKMQAQKITDKNDPNHRFMPAMFMNVCKVTSDTKSNDKYSWKVFKVALSRLLMEEPELFEKAKSQREIFQQSAALFKPVPVHVDEFPTE